MMTTTGVSSRRGAMGNNNGHTAFVTRLGDRPGRVGMCWEEILDLGAPFFPTFLFSSRACSCGCVKLPRTVNWSNVTRTLKKTITFPSTCALRPLSLVGLQVV